MRGAEVREQAKFLPKAKQALLGSDGGIVPLIAPDRAEKNGISLPTCVQGRFGKWIAMTVNRSTAEIMLGKAQAEAAMIRQDLEALDGLRNDLGANSIAWQDSYIDHAA